MRGLMKHRAEMALDKLHSANRYLEKQFDMTWPREKALANLQARAKLLHCANAILKEHGCSIRQAEL